MQGAILENSHDQSNHKHGVWAMSLVTGGTAFVVENTKVETINKWLNENSASGKYDETYW